MQNINAELQQLVNALNNMTRANSNAQERARIDAEKRRDTEKMLNAQTEEYLETIKKGKKLNEKQLDLEEKLRQAKKAELDIDKEIVKTQKKIEAALKKRDTEEAQRQQTILDWQKKSREKAGIATEKAETAFRRGLRGLADEALLTRAALVWLGQAIMNTVNQSRDQMVANAGLVEGTDYLSGQVNQAGQAFQKGIGAVDFAKLTTANRQMINALGGTTNALQAVEGSALDFYTMTGSQTEAYKLLLEASTSFAQKGIKPTQKVIQSYTEDVKTLSAQTGMSAEAAAQFYNSVHDDIDSITLLRAARADEREAILKSQRAMVQNAIAAGMSAEQAKEAAKMLNKMVAAKPLERIKQAAKVRAIGAALGIAGSGEAADALMAGKRATAGQKEALMRFNQNTTNAVDQASQQGMGAEIFANQLVDKLGMDNQYGPGSPFSTTLGTVLGKPIEETKAMYAEASKSVVGIGLQTLDVLKQMAKDIANGTIVINTLLGGFENLVHFFTGGDMSSWLYDAIQKSLPGMTEAFGDAIGLLIDGLKVMINGLGGAIIGGLGALVGKLFPSVGSAITEFGKSLWDSHKEAANRIAGAAGTGTAYDVSNQTTTKTLAAPKASSGITQAKVADQVSRADAEKSTSNDPVVKAAAQTANAAQDTSVGIQTQLKKMDDNAVLMQKLVTNSDKALELAEKQLIALTMTESERTSGVAQKNLRSDNRFGAQYGYI